MQPHGSLTLALFKLKNEIHLNMSKCWKLFKVLQNKQKIIFKIIKFGRFVLYQNPNFAYIYKIVFFLQIYFGTEFVIKEFVWRNILCILMFYVDHKTEIAQIRDKLLTNRHSLKWYETWMVYMIWNCFWNTHNFEWYFSCVLASIK